MKKIMMSLVVGLLVTGSVFGVEMKNPKIWYNSATSNGVVKMSDAYLANLFGSQEVLDICLSNNWDASLVAKAISGKEYSVKLAWDIGANLPLRERIPFVIMVADKHGKYLGMSWACLMSKTIAPDGTFDALFAMPDVVVDKVELNTSTYATSLSQKAKKVVLTSEFTVGDYANWLLLGGALKTTGQVTDAKEQIKRLSTLPAKRALRNKGKSFVSTTATNEAGVVTVINPIEQEMKPIVDALNAPKLAGLEAALAGIGVDVTSIVRDEAIWDAITAEKDAVFYGEKVAHPAADGGIILLLGPEGYNAWVKSYNEGTK